MLSVNSLAKKGLERFFNEESDGDDGYFEGFEFGPAHLKKQKKLEYEGGTKYNEDIDIESDEDTKKHKKKKRSCCSGDDDEVKLHSIQVDWNSLSEE